MIDKIISIKDGFQNVMKGLGSEKDPRTSTSYVPGIRINQQAANNLYTYNWLAAKVVDIPIDDATRKWRSFLIQDQKQKETIKDLEEKYDVKRNIITAFKWARIFGGAVIVAIIDGDDPSEPMNIDSVREGSLKNFLVFDRYNIYPDNIDRDIMSDNFGMPKYYTVSRSGQRIHHSRVKRAIGKVGTIAECEKENYWGSSIYTHMLEPITDSGVVSQSISNLVYEASVDVYRINGLNELIAEGNDDLVVSRLMIAHKMKSVINGIALDKEDEYDKKQISFSQLPEIDDRYVQKVSGASNIPVTRLLGISPAGQNATGESDMLNYYDSVQAIQENEIAPALDWMDSLILKSSGIKGLDSIGYEFLPLKQLTEIEQADVYLKNAQRDQIYLDNSIVDPIDILSQIADDGTYSSIDENRVDEYRKSLEMDAYKDGDGYDSE